MDKDNGRKQRVLLDDNQREAMRLDYVAMGAGKGVVTQLAGKYKVARKTASKIINSVRKLQKLKKDTEKRTKELQHETNKALITKQIIDTYQERSNLIIAIKNMDISPVMRELKEAYEQKRQAKITPEQKRKFDEAIPQLERLFTGIDNSNKVDIHFHVTKVLNVLQNMTVEESRLIQPELKRMLCDNCPAYKAYQEKLK